MFASTELALYAIRPAQSGEHRDSLQTILRTPEDNNLLSDRAIYAVMVTLAGKFESLRYSPCPLQPLHLSYTPPCSLSCTFLFLWFIVFHRSSCCAHGTPLNQF